MPLITSAAHLEATCPECCLHANIVLADGEISPSFCTRIEGYIVADDLLLEGRMSVEEHKVVTEQIANMQEHDLLPMLAMLAAAKTAGPRHRRAMARHN